jgi:RNA polymerase sigma-70 factor (ECF subfamily)
MDEPDPAVIRGAAAGDTASFEALVRHVQPHVWRFLRHLTGDGDLAADLTQETLVRVHRGVGGFRFDCRFSTWVFRIARNAAVDEVRASARRRRLQDAVAAQPVARVASGPGLAVELRAAVAGLPLRLREAFVLVEVFGLRYREAAAVLGVPEGTVKSRVFLARRELVAWLRDGDEPGATGRDEPGATGRDGQGYVGG